MYEIQCLDTNGNIIEYFTQWDVDQKIVIPIDNYEVLTSPEYSSPEVQFCNKQRTEALVVHSTAIDSHTIIADVPNILLQEPYPLLIYVYLTDSEDVSSQKTILHNEIIIRRRAEPSDYDYIENIERITAEMIKEEIEQDVEETKVSAIESINSTKNEATVYVTKSESLYNNTVDVYNDTVAVYNDTVAFSEDTKEQMQTEIENNILTKLVENGTELSMTDDGNGNVTMSIIMTQA